MMHLARLNRLAAVPLVAALTLACGSHVPTAPPATAPPTPAPTVPVNPAPSPTPVPDSPTDFPDGSVFRVQLVAPDGKYRLPVVLRDATGLVTGIAATPPGKPVPNEGIDNPDGQPDVLLYTWIGGVCDTVGTITFERTGSRFRLRSTTATTGQICELMGLQRQLLIRLNEPIEATLVNVAED